MMQQNILFRYLRRAIMHKEFVFNADTPVVKMTFVGSENDHESKASLENKLHKFVDRVKLEVHYTNPGKNINADDLEELKEKIASQDSIINLLLKK